MPPRTQRTNSPIDDPLPYEAPVSQPTVIKVPKNDYQKVGTSRKYKEIERYFAERRAFYQKYLPSGETIIGLTKAQRVTAWENAVVILSELDAWESRIQGEVAVLDPIK